MSIEVYLCQVMLGDLYRKSKCCKEGSNVALGILPGFTRLHPCVSKHDHIRLLKLSLRNQDSYSYRLCTTTKRENDGLSHYICSFHDCPYTALRIDGMLTL